MIYNKLNFPFNISKTVIYTQELIKTLTEHGNPYISKEFLA